MSAATTSTGCMACLCNWICCRDLAPQAPPTGQTSTVTVTTTAAEARAIATGQIFKDTIGAAIEVSPPSPDSRGDANRLGSPPPPSRTAVVAITALGLSPTVRRHASEPPLPIVI